jgi:hypothetical protein
MAYNSINEHKADVIRDKDGKANPYVARIEDVKTFDDKYPKSKTYVAWFMVARIKRPSHLNAGELREKRGRSAKCN